MPMYVSDIGIVYPGTTLDQVIEAARVPPEQAGEWADEIIEGAEYILEQVSKEELIILLTEAGERSLNLSALVRGEISTLMKVKEEINRERRVWTVTLPSGVLVFVEYEDYCVEIQEAKFNR